MILTPDQLREHVTTALEDDALKRLLDAAEATIIEVAGPPGAEIVELVEGGYGRLVLSRPAAEIVSVRDGGGTTWTDRAVDDDYTFVPTSILRRTIGYRWLPWVEVTYIPANDAALRMHVQIRLVELALNQPAGIGQNSAGGFAEQYPANSVYNYEIQRQEILSVLSHSPGMAVI
jgi:hypothetical protein